MKLVDEFRRQVESLGAIKRAWFTTFNLGIPFFESNVLPALLNLEKPGNRADFEDIQSQVAGIDVRVFCDLRMMEADQLKRTAVPIHGLLPARMGQQAFGDDSLFHPKVVFLEDKDGRMVLGAGSANLTVSGWGRNQEAFTFRPVCTNEQYQQVKRFFEPLVQAAGAADAMALDVKRKFQQGDGNWRFVHSFERHAFLDQLLEESEVERLTVWSPYFARDLPGLLRRIQSAYGAGMKFSIVPDRAGNRRVRTVWKPEIGEMLRSGDLSFHAYPSPRAPEIELTHAKLWLVSGKKSARLAIGSWNCTGKGTASLDERNIEAGIILRLDRKHDIAGKPLPLDSSSFSSPDMLEEEAPELLDPPPFDLQVVFDWQRSQYHVEGRLFSANSREGYSLRLPAIQRSFPLRWKDRRSQGAWALEPIDFGVADDEALLANHCYEVWFSGDMVFRGLIQETGQDHRRAQGYDSLRDLLDDLVGDVKPENSGTAKLRKALRHNDVPEDQLPAPDLGQVRPLSYFRVFQAFEQFRKRLRGVQDQDELDRILFVHPGSLQEFVARIEEHVKAAPHPVFNWFLRKELETLYTEAEKQWDGRRTRPEKWKSLKPARPLPALPSGIQGNSAYTRQLKELYRDES